MRWCTLLYQQDIAIFGANSITPRLAHASAVPPLSCGLFGLSFCFILTLKADHSLIFVSNFKTGMYREGRTWIKMYCLHRVLLFLCVRGIFPGNPASSHIAKTFTVKLSTTARRLSIICLYDLKFFFLCLQKNWQLFSSENVPSPTDN